MDGLDFPYTTFRLADRLFGLESSYVHEMLVLPELAHVPTAKEHIRGVINIRGKVILVVDLRKMMRMATVTEDTENLIELLGKREQDHLNWIAELENSIKERREFKLTTDPHKCAFGKWYDAYKAKNVMMENHLKKFDAPHKRIHALGTEAVALAKDQKYDDALALVARERMGTLSLLVNLFAEAKTLLRETMREIVIVLGNGENSIGVSVDNIESVEHLKEGSIEDIRGISTEFKHALVTKIGKTLRGEKIVMLINTSEIFQDSNPVARTVVAEATGA
ncbi:MAG: chemotaxis protein CheW [Nitrospinae bacterium]|nr:chemotaxis protein CheW [Nitrospinota bacterium]